MRPESFKRKIRTTCAITINFFVGLALLMTACSPATTTSSQPQMTITPPASNETKVTVNGTAQVVVGNAPPATAPIITPAANPVVLPALQLRWFGQSTFLLTSSIGTKILMDPVNAQTGYNITPINGVDVVTITHEHSDHNNVSLAPGNPLVLHGLSTSGWNAIDQTVKGVRIISPSPAVPFYHDNTSGTQRGRNTVFIFEVDGLRIAHLGDLGHTLSPEAISAIGPVDVIMIPVGGSYTIDAAAATTVVDQLKPKIVIPMHYKTPVMSANWPGTTADAFLTGKNVQRPNSTSINISKSTLPTQTTVVVLNYQ